MRYFLVLLVLAPFFASGQGIKISEMPSATSLSGSEFLPIVQTSNKKATVGLVRGWTSIGTANQLLRVNSGATALEFFTPSYLSGIVSIANGGTGLSTLGTANQQLRVNGAGTALEYFTPSGGSYTFSNGLTESGGTVKLGGSLVENTTIDLDGYNLNLTDGEEVRISGSTEGLLQSNGSTRIGYEAISGSVNFRGFGTDIDEPFIQIGSDATGDIYYRNSGGRLARLAAGTDGHVLTLASGIPSWAAPSGGSGLTIGSTSITGGTSGRLLTSGTTVGEQTLGTGISTWLSTPSWTNFQAAITGTSPYWSLASGGTLTGANTITGSTTNKLQFDFGSLGTAYSNVFMLNNPTDAASGNQQISPPLVMRGRGWKTNATAESQTVDFIQYVIPTQGAANPSGAMYWYSSINGGGNTSLMNLSSSGTLSTTGSLSVGGNIAYFSNRGMIHYNADGRIGLYNNAANNFDRLQFGGTTSSFPSLKRSSAILQARLADDSDFADFQASGFLVGGSNRYINFNSTVGSSGYGVRDNLGTLELKNSGGSWSTPVVENPSTGTVDNAGGFVSGDFGSNGTSYTVQTSVNSWGASSTGFQGISNYSAYANNTVIIAEYVILAMKSDGTAAASGTFTARFRKNNSGTWIADSGGTLSTSDATVITTAVGDINGGVPGYTWTSGAYSGTYNVGVTVKISSHTY